MPKKALTQKTMQDVPQSRQLWPSINEVAREDPEGVLQHSQPESPTIFQMGRTQNESGVVWITTIFMAIFHLGAIAALFFFS